MGKSGSKSRTRREGFLAGVSMGGSAPWALGKSRCSTPWAGADFVYRFMHDAWHGRGIDGADYHFIRRKFAQKLTRGVLNRGGACGIITARCGRRWSSHWRRGGCVIDIDVQGARQTAAMRNPRWRVDRDIFIMPPSLEELRHRL